MAPNRTCSFSLTSTWNLSRHHQFIDVLKGYNHTGVQEVLDAASVPKGSFYFYFKNKEDFGLHVIDFFNNMFLEILEPIFNDKTITG